MLRLCDNGNCEISISAIFVTNYLDKQYHLDNAVFSPYNIYVVVEPG